MINVWWAVTSGVPLPLSIRESILPLSIRESIAGAMLFLPLISDAKVRKISTPSKPFHDLFPIYLKC